MLKKLFIFFVLFVLCCCLFSVFVIAEGEETTTIDQTTVEQTTVSETITDHSIDDIYNILVFLLIGVGIVSGCLIAQGFSFWKW